MILRKTQRKHEIALAKVKRKKKIKVVFFLIHESVWKYEALYKLMINDERFEPIVIICPYIITSKDNMHRQMNEAYQSFKDKGYSVIKTFDEKSGVWLNVKDVIKPDIIFFTNPYQGLTKPEYFVTNFSCTLTFYAPYSFMITKRPEMQYNELLHNSVYKIFHESKFHKAQAKIFSFNKGINSVVTGFPALDLILTPAKILQNVDVWKINDCSYKRIIWAPHHTIEKEDTVFNYSNFLEYADFFLELADKYKDVIMFSFKPHPILKSKLLKLSEWGPERTEKYYTEWQNRNNCQLDEGEYVDLFLTSDALIHDSGSFLVEYLATNKPSLYMIRNEIVLDGFTDLGNQIVSSHYKSYSKEDVEDFIDKVVRQGIDSQKINREVIIESYLKPPFGNTASENIMIEINNILLE